MVRNNVSAKREALNYKCESTCRQRHRSGVNGAVVTAALHRALPHSRAQNDVCVCCSAFEALHSSLFISMSVVRSLLHSRTLQRMNNVLL